MAEKDDTLRELSATLAAPVSGTDPLQSSQPSQARFVVGAIVGGRYQLLAELGRGAHGAVFRAHDRHADTEVALKILTDLRDDYLALLRRELSAARRVTHRGVVRMFDLVEIEGGWALSMELVEGRSLEREIEAGRATPKRLAELASRLAEALAAAHDAGVVHRDLKPQNILVRPDGGPVITDFGVSRVSGSVLATHPPARPSGPEVKLTVDGSLLGTPLYMAPEQLEGRTDVGPTVDVYAFGLILYEAATGRVPHDASTIVAVRDRRTNEPVSPLAGERPDVPATLCSVIDRCLLSDPLSRFADGAAIYGALHPSKPSIAQSRRATQPRAFRHTPWIALGLAGLAGGVWLYAGRRGSSIDSPEAPAAPPIVPAEASRPPFRLDLKSPRRLTFGPLCEEYPSFFPDGKRLVFDLTEGVKSHLVEIDIETKEQRRLTESPLWDFGATVSPNGHEVAFLRQRSNGTFAMILDVASGEVKELEKSRVRPTFARGGSEIWLGQGRAAKRIELATGTSTLEVESPPDTTVIRLSELDADRTIALLRSGSELIHGEVAVYDARTQAWTRSEPLVYYDVLERSVDGSTFFFNKSESELGTWAEGFGQIPKPAPLARLRTGFDLSPDGKHAVWSTCGGQVGLSGLEGGRFRPLMERTQEWSDSDAAYLSDGRIVIASDRKPEMDELWIYSSSQADPTTLPVGGGAIRELAARGTRVAAATANGIRLLDLAGTEPPETLTRSAGDRGPTFDRKGGIVFYRADQSMLRIGPSGGEPTRLPAEGHTPTASSRDDLIVYVPPDGLSLMALDSRGARAFGRDLPAGSLFEPKLSPDGTKLAVVLDKTQLLVIDVRSERVERATKLERGSIVRPVFANDGSIHVLGADWIGDLWVADLE